MICQIDIIHQIFMKEIVNKITLLEFSQYCLTVYYSWNKLNKKKKNKITLLIIKIKKLKYVIDKY